MSALYRGDTQNWWPGCVVNINQEQDNSTTYTVQFDDGDYDNSVKSKRR